MLEDELKDVLRERDDAEDFINELLDEVLGAERPEWSSAYNRYDAMNDVRERITALHKPAVDKAWGRFESATAEHQPSPAAQEDALDAPVDAAVQQDAERWQFFAEYLVSTRTDLDDEIVGCDSVQKMARVLDAARAAQEGK